MKGSSLAKNAAFNGLKTLSCKIFPIVTFAYAARILGQAGIGKVNFCVSVVSCFTMLAMLGMQYYGTREAAKRRDDPDALSKFAQEMLLLNACTTAAAYMLLFAAIAAVPKLQGYTVLLLITSADILLQGMGMEWLYQAVEGYRYIAVRSMVFQGISLVLLFLFVRKPQDVAAYAVIHLLANSGSQVLNFFHARKYIRLRHYHDYEFRKHWKPLLRMFAVMVSVEIYTVMDTTMLGFLQNDAAVGRYTAAVKVNKLVCTLITSFGAVLLPRLSYYIGQQKSGQIEGLVHKMYNYMFMISVPAAVGLFMLSDEIILLFSGSGFAAAAKTMRILTPIVLLIPFNVTTHQQLFVPMGQDKPLLHSTVTGAVVNFTCNLLLIPRFAENGAAIATVVAELGVLLVCFWNMRRFYSQREIFAHYGIYWLASLPIPLIAIVLRQLPVYYVARMALVVIASASAYFGILWVMKAPYLREGVRALQNTFGGRAPASRREEN